MKRKKEKKKKKIKKHIKKKKSLKNQKSQIKHMKFKIKIAIEVEKNFQIGKDIVNMTYLRPQLIIQEIGVL